MKCNDRNNHEETQNFIQSTKTTISANNSGAISLPTIESNFLFNETSSNISGGESVFSSFERHDFVQISKIKFCYIKYSAKSIRKSVGRFKIQLLRSDFLFGLKI